MVTWVHTSGIVPTKLDAALVIDLLVRAGLLDIIETEHTRIHTSESTSQLNGDTSTSYNLYRFRCDASSIQKVSKSGWLDKVCRWRVYRRYFVWDTDIHRLSYFHSNKVSCHLVMLY